MYSRKEQGTKRQYFSVKLNLTRHCHIKCVTNLSRYLEQQYAASYVQTYCNLHQ